MALILKEKEFGNGLKASNVYCKVVEINCKDNIMSYKVGLYLSKESRLLNKPTIETYTYSCEHNLEETAKNSIKQAYENLKTIDEYVGAIDDLD